MNCNHNERFWANTHTDMLFYYARSDHVLLPPFIYHMLALMDTLQSESAWSGALVCNFCELTVDGEVERVTSWRFQQVLGCAGDWPYQICTKNSINDEQAAILHYMHPIHHHGSGVVQPEVWERRPFCIAGEDYSAVEFHCFREVGGDSRIRHRVCGSESDKRPAGQEVTYVRNIAPRLAGLLLFRRDWSRC